MKMRYKIGLFALLVLLGSCKALDKLTKFDIDYTYGFEVPSSIGINLPISISSPPIATNTQTTFANNNTKADLIESVFLKQFNLQLNSPSSGNFNFLKSIELYLSANGVAEKKVAWKYNIANDNINLLPLEYTSDDLKEFLVKDSITIRCVTEADELILSNYQMEAKLKFGVDAKIFGI